MTFQIVENPTTKELYLRGAADSITNFGGTSFSVKLNSTNDWAVIAEAPHGQHWFDEPGQAYTFYAWVQVSLVEPSGKVHLFTIGGCLATINNWIKDAKDNGNQAHGLVWRAFTDRNVARNLADCQM